MTIIVRPVDAADRTEWETLYRAYAAFYEVEQTEQMRATVWSWLHDPAHTTNGLVAVDGGGTLVGLAHFRPFERPLAAAMGGFLDDLFVSPQARGSGAAQALIDALKTRAADEGWSVLRWITAQDNYRARSAYDKLATQTAWVTYDIQI
ncbi:GNAT family N-acetyltransferase [Sulfitobacter sp. S190]|uniref:GNAT family N-acetyltransferase n=1 Tax=Sulfitobacter sp. S190 TaxID=2867022 RepID=UPI0021A672D1|nr:GNAT family N-acetyltransferase [Sulfitobacter sp. S190]UWR23353.1 GNAT family N-acetyltransferase [Sulfitobacter sp. S190]